MTDATRRFEDARRLLVLSALSYRGFQSGHTPQLQSERVHGAVTRGLTKLADVCGMWELVWGPVTYRAPFSIVDDNLMFVVRNTTTPNEYVVVVRGTNPVSPFDWLFGDFWVAAQAPWDHHAGARNAGAKVSLSTLLGLNLLRSMQAPPPPGLNGSLGHLVIARIADAADQMRAWLQPLASNLAAEVCRIRDEVLPVLTELEVVRRGSLVDGPETRARALLDMWRSTNRRHLLRALADAVALVGEEQSFNVLRFFSGGDRLRNALIPGVTLVAFLQAAVAAADGAPLRVTVTGHSKGGALAPTLALWLADTQGPVEGSGVVAWDPNRQARVHCVTFAGPTAGNGAFAAHSDATIGARCHRVVNPLDVVPQAWEAGTLATIPALYHDAAPSALIRDLVAEISAEVARFGYTHIGSHVTALATHEDPLRRDFFLQAGYQHLAAYLDALGLDTFTDVATFFSPLA
jgi:hypothetical protein